MRFMSALGAPVVVTDDGSAYIWSAASKSWAPTDPAWLDHDADVREYTSGGFKVLLGVLDIPLASMPTDAGGKRTPPASTNSANSGLKAE